MSNQTIGDSVSTVRLTEALTRLGQAIKSNCDLSDIYQNIANDLLELTGAYTAVVANQEQGGSVLEFIAVAGLRTDELIGLHIETNLSIARSAFTNEHLGPQMLEEPGSVATIICGIRLENETSGAIILMAAPGATFLPQHLSIVETFSEAAALALKFARMDQLSESQSREITALYNSATSVGDSLNVQVVLNSVIEVATAHRPDVSAVLFLVNDDRTHLFIAAEKGLIDEEREVQLSIEDNIPTMVFSSGNPLQLPKSGPISLLEPLIDPSRAKCGLVAPILFGNDPLGLVIVFSPQEYRFLPSDARMLTASAAHAGVAISNAWLHEEMSNRAEQNTTLFDISNQLGSTLNTLQICLTVVDTVRPLIFCDQVAVLMPKGSDSEERLTVAASGGITADNLGSYNFRIGCGIAGWVYEWMTPTAVADISADSRNLTSPIHHTGITSCVCVPISSADKVIGVLMASTSYRRLFTVGEVEMLYTIANIAGGALENARQYEMARNRSIQLRKYFLRLAQSLGTNLPPESAPNIITDLVKQAMQTDACVIYRLEDGVVTAVASSGIRAQMIGYQIPVGVGLAGTIAAKGRSLLVNDISQNVASFDQEWLQKEKFSSYLGIPLKVDRKIVGVIEVLSTERRTFLREEITLLSKFVSRSNVAGKLQLLESDAT